MVVRVQACREVAQANPGGPSRGVMTSVRGFGPDAKWLMPCFQEKPLSFRSRGTVPQTDTGGQVENTKALERTRVKELGKMVP